jgi:flagellar basal-body rod protein FlgB
VDLPFVTKTDVLIRGGLDGMAARHRALVDNIANVDTPGFQPSDVPFEQQLRSIRDQLDDDPSAMSARSTLSFQPVPDAPGDDRVDGNGVRMDDQVMRLEENSLAYDSLTQAAKMREQLLRDAIAEGRK